MFILPVAAAKKSSKILWVCSRCGKGKRGLQRPRKNDIVRYCFPCSEETGCLVERKAPKLEKKRKTKLQKAVEKAKKEREKTRHVLIIDGVDLMKASLKMMNQSCHDYIRGKTETRQDMLVEADRRLQEGNV